MLRVWAIEEHVNQARLKDARFLLVCYDVWDRGRGDADLGYYYPAFSTIAQVREFLNKVQLGADTRDGIADVCEAVIDLSLVGDKFDIAFCEDPTAWLAKMNSMN